MSIRTPPIPKLLLLSKPLERFPNRSNCGVKYLNNLIEQDHRFIKRLVKPGLGFFCVETAGRTGHRYEVMNMIRKGQMHGVGKGDIPGQVAFIASLFRVAA